MLKLRNSYFTFSRAILFVILSAFAIICFVNLFPDTTHAESITTGGLIWPANTPECEINTLYYYNKLVINGSSSHSSHFSNFNSIDIGSDGKSDVEILAAADGKVKLATNSTTTGFGNYIIITHDDGTETWYCHLKSMKVKPNDSVRQGQVIGIMGNTSAKYKIGVHLHFEWSGGNPWEKFYKNKYSSKVRISQDVYQANKKHDDNACKNLVRFVDTCCILNSNGNYYIPAWINILSDIPQVYVDETKGFSWEVGGTLKRQSVKWETSNSSVLTVDNNGSIKGVSEGTATVTAYAEQNGKKICAKSKSVKVIGPKVTLAKSSLTMYKGQSYLLTCYVKGNPLGKKIKWSSSKSKIAAVTKKSDDKHGAIIAKSVGTCNITAKIGKSSASCTVTVKEPTISLNKSSISLSKGDNCYLRATVKGASKTVTWSTSNKAIATVEKGKVVAKKAGTAIITATANGVTATCKVTVKKTKVTLKIKPTSKKIYVGDSFAITATVSGTTNKVSWSSSNTSVATVSTSGYVKGKAKGTSTITAKVGEKTAKCKVTVKTKSSSSGGGCITPDTLIALADGSQKRVDELENTDIIKVYDFDNGIVTVAPITLFHRVKKEEQVLRVVFSDGTSIGVVKDHCFFDLTDRRFVTIYTEKQADELDGHMFAVLKDDEISEVELVDIRIDGKTDSYYAPVSEVHLNCFTNNLLSMPGYVRGFCNVFELEENELKYDAAKKAEAIRNVSESNADGLAFITNLDVYKKNKLDWIRVSIAKGMISIQELKDLYVFCLPFFVN